MRPRLCHALALLLLLSLTLAGLLVRQHRQSHILLEGQMAKLSPFGNICHGRQCQAALDSATDGVDRVPRIRHILWKSDQVSTYFAKQLRSWHEIHPGWTYVLWRDSDLVKLVAKHYSGALEKFRSLKEHIMRVDMARYLILYRYGGVYADLDYILIMANPASSVFTFAGPLGLSAMLKRYAIDQQPDSNGSQIVFVPASRAFSSYANNSLRSSTSEYKGGIISSLDKQCGGIRSSKSAPAALKTYCKDVYNLDPITDPSELAYAIHDSNKARSSYDARGSPQFYEHVVNIRSVLPKVMMADEII